MTPLDRFTYTPKIAYFSMEVALRPEIHTYSGGLGILAGDTARSAADLEIPLVVITLVSRAGYIQQEIDDNGNQIEHSDPWEPNDWALPLRAKIAINIERREVWLRPWLYILPGISGYEIPILLLDSDVVENAPEDRKITNVLYGGDNSYRFKQEAVLGIGGMRMLGALGFETHTYHLNEGHSALLALELLRRHRRPEETVGPGECNFDIGRVKERCVFTTHTPVESGHDRFSYSLVEKVLDDYFDINELKLLAGKTDLNMTQLALSLSGRINGVSSRHAQIARQQFPQFKVNAITNGVHPRTWTCGAVVKLYDHYFPEWLHQPSVLIRADQIPAQEIWAAHLDAKRNLITYIKEKTGEQIELDSCVLGFARRMTGYKRPDLLFTDLERLKTISKRYPLQIILAGKAHPSDERGKELISQLNNHIKTLSGYMRIVYVQNYDMEVAQYLTSGVDIWLNTPMPPMEASGTSGIKAAFNGIPHLSVLDGWWIEGYIEGVTGWAIDTTDTQRGDAVCLYNKLEQVVLPIYYDDRAAWIQIMKNVMSKNTRFNSHGMMRRYAAEAYLR